MKQPTIDQIVTRYESGEPSTAIAAALSISKGSIIRLLRDAGIPIRNQGLTHDQIAKAAQLYTSGQSLVQIGAHLGVDRGTVRRRLLKRGIKMRDTHGRTR